MDWNHTDGCAAWERWGSTRAKVNEGGYRVTLLLPTGQPERSHCVEAAAPSEATAVRLALQR